jgi:hypothetical protein
MKFCPRLYEIKLAQKLERPAYIAGCDLFIITEGGAARSYTGNKIDLQNNQYKYS